MKISVQYKIGAKLTGEVTKTFLFDLLKKI